LQERKAFHDSLFARAAGLRTATTIIESTRNVLNLAYSYFADLEIDPVEYVNFQRGACALFVFQQYTSGRALREFIERNTEGAFDDVHGAELRRRVGPGQVLVPAVAYANEWRARWSTECNVAFNVVTGDTGRNALRIALICEVANGIARSAALKRLSSHAIEFVPIGSGFSDFVGCNVVPGFENITDGSDAGIDFVGGDVSKAMHLLLVSAEKVLEREFAERRFGFNMGENIEMFLEIERRLRPILVDEGSSDVAELPKDILGGWCRGKEPWFFRAALMDALMLIDEDDGKEIREVEGFEGIKEALENLRDWFGICKHICMTVASE
jgi:hypothetical protein